MLAVILLLSWLPDFSRFLFESESTPEDEIRRDAETMFVLGTMRLDDPISARGRFATAAREYEELRQRGCSTADLYRNQGNANFLAGDLPRAILAYRRGLRVDPADRELQWLLAHARSKVTQGSPAFGGPPADERPPWLPRLATLPVLAAAFGLYALGCLLWTRWLMVRRGRWRTWGTVALAGTGLLMTAVGWDAWQLERDREPPLVVVRADNVYLRKGNGPHYAAVADVPLGRGVEARLRHERGDWVQIELSGGQIGWLPREAVVVDSDK